MKKLFVTILLILGLGLAWYYQEPIVDYILENFIYSDEIILGNDNEYKRNYNYGFVQATDDFVPNNKQEIINIIYTFLDRGWDTFSFYCPKEYTECSKNVEEITNNRELLSSINNFVHPFNSYQTLLFSIDNRGKVTLINQKVYTEEQINIINQKVDQIIAQIINANMNDKDKITAIHNYIINNTVYDRVRANDTENNSGYLSHTAYGVLISGKGICGGYSDAMAIFLNRLNINNYKISSDNHIWNYVKLDNNWYHLDLTWDDPISNTGENILTHNFFLINTQALEQKATSQHVYNKNTYIEAQ